ncbi:MAG: hypothetical protein DI596_03465 [Azospira oryzae]|nr:MAG: hypothetical protein DI596_03465 [Azospira oryzae]PZP81747.1 MAG: hypothetical protein DI593_03465 [Azospira oryzae]
MGQTVMNRTLVFIAFALGCTGAAAQATYKWKDAKGGIHYGDTPPWGVDAERVIEDARYAVNPEACRTIRCQLDRIQASKRLEAEAEAAAARPEASRALPSPRGLPFEVFVHLRRGMTESEVLSRAGPPDLQSVEGVDEVQQTLAEAQPTGPRHGRGFSSVRVIGSRVVKTWTYLPTASDAFTTVITFRGGRVENIERIRKF